MRLNALKTSFLNNSFFTSIRSRILLYFIILILLPTSVISLTIYNISSGLITKKINSSLEEKLNVINIDIIQKFEYINDLSTKIYLNRDFINILSSQHPTDNTNLISEMSVMDKLLSNYSVSTNSQTVIIPKIYIFNRPEYLLYNFTDNVSDFSVIEKETWYKTLPSEAKYSVVGLTKTSVSNQRINTIRIAKKLFGLDDMRVQFSGVLTVDVGVDYFSNILAKSKPTQTSSTFILDARNSVIMSSDPSSLGKNMNNQQYINKISVSKIKSYGSFIEKINNVKNFVAYEKIEPLNLTIVSLTPMSELNGELNSFTRVIYFIIILCIFLAIFMAFVLSNNIFSPIRKLVNSMKVVQGGNFDISLEYKRNDEFSYLIKTYKRMVAEIKELIDKLYVSEVRKKEAELKSLQSQINPHFLYNTLDSINWMALELNATNISTMVTSLSNFFRYSLNKGKDVIALGDEFKQVESYLKIQKIRFQDKLEYSITCPRDVYSFLSVKLILQPIVENSIIHGINKIAGNGILAISAEKTDDIIEIKISDNGIGADVDELNSILSGKSSNASFGMRNVNERIKHYFGDNYGITYSSNSTSGITAILRFPAAKRMEDLYAKDDIGRR